MNRLIATGLIAAATMTPVSRADESPCPPGGVYVGAYIGYSRHNIKLKIRKGSVEEAITKSLESLAEVVDYTTDIKEGLEEVVAAKQKNLTEASSVAETASSAVSTATASLDAAVQAFAEALYEAHKIGDNPDDNTIGSTSFTTGTIGGLANAGTITGRILSDSQVLAALGEATAASSLMGLFTAGHKEAYNSALRDVVDALVKQAFVNGGEVAGLDTSAFSYTPATTSGTAAEAVTFSEEASDAFTAASEALQAKEEALEVAQQGVSAAQAELANAVSAAATAANEYASAEAAIFKDQGKTILDNLAKTNGVQDEVTRIATLEYNELGLNEARGRSVSRSAFTVGAKLEFIKRVESAVFGAIISGGFDTYKEKLRDKDKSTSSSSTKNGIEVKKPFNIDIQFKIGCHVTPPCVVYIAPGISLGKSKVDLRGMTTIHDKIGLLEDIANAYNTYKAQKVAECEAIIANAGSSAEAKAGAEALKERYTNAPTVVEPTTGERKVLKSFKCGPVLEVGVDYFVTPDVIINLGGKYYLPTKMTNFKRTGDVKIRHDSFTFFASASFKLG